jgi:hypothetical protein
LATIPLVDDCQCGYLTKLGEKKKEEEKNLIGTGPWLGIID